MTLDALGDRKRKFSEISTQDSPHSPPTPPSESGEQLSAAEGYNSDSCHFAECLKDYSGFTNGSPCPNLSPLSGLASPLPSSKTPLGPIFAFPECPPPEMVEYLFEFESLKEGEEKDLEADRTDWPDRSLSADSTKVLDGLAQQGSTLWSELRSNGLDSEATLPSPSQEPFSPPICIGLNGSTTETIQVEASNQEVVDDYDNFFFKWLLGEPQNDVFDSQLELPTENDDTTKDDTTKDNTTRDDTTKDNTTRDDTTKGNATRNVPLTATDPSGCFKLTGEGKILFSTYNEKEKKKSKSSLTSSTLFISTFIGLKNARTR